MTTPHEAVAKANDRILFADPLTQVDAETRQALVPAAIEALREEAVERFLALRLIAEGDLPYERDEAERIVEAILGPPNEVPDHS